MKITIKTVEEMRATPGVVEIPGRHLKKGEGSFILDSPMESDLCGKTFEPEVDDGRRSEDYSYAVCTKGDPIPWYIPSFAVKEILDEEPQDEI